VKGSIATGVILFGQRQNSRTGVANWGTASGICYLPKGIEGELSQLSILAEEKMNSEHWLDDRDRPLEPEPVLMLFQPGYVGF